CRSATCSTSDWPGGCSGRSPTSNGWQALASSCWGWCWLPAPEEVSMKKLPFTRPTIDEETIQGVVEVLRSGWVASGPNVIAFEAALSKYLGGRPIRTQTSATASMEM